MTDTRLFSVRCSACKEAFLVNATLEAARALRCRTCGSRMTVAGYQEAEQMKPGEPPTVTKAPRLETAYWKLTPEGETVARRLVLSVFGEKE